MYLHASPMVAPTDSEVPRMVMDRAPCESKYLPEKMDPAKVRNDCSVPIHLRTDMSSKIEVVGMDILTQFRTGNTRTIGFLHSTFSTDQSWLLLDHGQLLLCID